MSNTTALLKQSNRRILVIDDNAEIHNDFRKVLGTASAQASALDGMEAALFDDEARIPTVSPAAEEGFEIDSAYQGQEGLQMVQRATAEGRPYAMAFVDVRMPPGWDGIETISQIWRQFPDLQVVISTAYSDYSWKDIVKNLGATDSLLILKKPFDNIEVLQLAHALTKKWLLTAQANARMQDLDRMVQERTQELQAANERFSKAFRASPLSMGICTLSNCSFLDVNDSFVQLFGVQREAVLGHSDRELGTWADSADQDKFWYLVRKSGTVREMRCRLRVKAGAFRDALVFAEPLELNHEKCLLVLFHDVTEQLKAESQLRQSQKMEAVGQLAAGVAHDFNNLLTVIRGHAEMRLLTSGLDQELASSLTQITRASDRASSLTRQLLSFSQRYMIQPKALALNELITSHREMIQSLVAEQITIECNLADKLPPVFGDCNNLEQVLMNLVVNAREAMPQGGRLTLKTSLASTDDVKSSPDGQANKGAFVCLTIQDTGCGMDAQTLNRLFEPFFTTKQLGKGTGMGLATAYGIVKQHGGWIKVSSQLGQGTIFRVFLPATTQAPRPEAKVDSLPSIQRGSETILLVEDDPDLRAMAVDALGSAGYRVLSAASGTDALKVWAMDSQKIDLVFSDLVMPQGPNGRQLAEKLRANKPGLKIVLTTGHGASSKTEASGCSDALFIPKPYSPVELVNSIRNCLDDNHPVQGACAN